MSLSYIYSYLYYISEARNQYFVHSPFVYSMMTQCINKRYFLFYDTPKKLLARFTAFMEQEHANIDVIGKEKDLGTYCSAVFNAGDVLFIMSPHCGKNREKAFNALCERKDITLSIDLFHVGIVFPHRDMVKEHFILKYL
ncbi:MAG: hypothetical protein PHD21_05410 [Flavobacteriales bacterium]|nr:hypothetical protein [Flavobacteriales bacterium]